MIITKVSHLDHGLRAEHLEYLLTHFADRSGFFIETLRFPIPLDMEMLPCRLRGPAVGDEPVGDEETRFECRGRRAWPSRVCDRPFIWTDVVTVIAGPHDGMSCVLYTAYGGPLAPKEPHDPTLKPEEFEASIVFWERHALCADGVEKPGVVNDELNESLPSSDVALVDGRTVHEAIAADIHKAYSTGTMPSLLGTRMD